MKIANIEVPYAQIPNNVLFDSDLSWKAKGIWAYIQAKPDDWNFSSERMAKDSTDGIDSTLAALKELKLKGYLLQKRTKTGQVTYQLTEKATTGISLEGNFPHRENRLDNKERVIQRKSITKIAPAKAVAPEKPWNLEEKLQDMESKEGSHLDIIATFIREKNVKVENAKELSAVISRHSKTASLLAKTYTPEKIFAAIDKIKKENRRRSDRGDEVDWTLETIMKVLTK